MPGRQPPAAVQGGHAPSRAKRDPSALFPRRQAPPACRTANVSVVARFASEERGGASEDAWRDALRGQAQPKACSLDACKAQQPCCGVIGAY